MSSDPNAWTNRVSPSLDDIAALAENEFRSLPLGFRDLAGTISFAVADFAEESDLNELEIESAYDLLGLFHGLGLAQAPGAPVTGMLPNRILLYRRPILDYWAEHDVTLGAVVSHVLVHEIGHHFGLSDEDMETIEAASD